MKKNILIIISVCLILFSTTCALEIANVIGPDGGYVFYDKGSYNYGWRYIQCSSYDFGNVKVNDSDEDKIKNALKLCSDNNANWHKLGWELPTEDVLRKLLECFSYGFTRFSPDYYYLAVNNLYDSERWWVCSYQWWICGFQASGTTDPCGEKNSLIINNGQIEPCKKCGEPPKNDQVYEQCLMINKGNFCTDCGTSVVNHVWVSNKDAPPNPSFLKNENDWEIVILHKNFEQAANGTVERVTEVPDDLLIRVRAIRRF